MGELIPHWNEIPIPKQFNHSFNHVCNVNCCEMLFGNILLQ